MKKTKAVILERSGNVYSVLAEDGSFRSVRLNSGKEVGQEIELRERRIVPPAWMSAVALFLIVITAAFSWQNHKEATATVAVLSVDINPSLELKLDANRMVQGASGLNTDGTTLLQGVSVKGKESGEVLSLLVERAIQLHYLSADHPWVVLGASPEGTTTALPLSGLADTVTKVGAEKGLSVNVAAFQLTTGEEDEARAKGLTPGEYGLWLSAQKAGVTVPEQAVKDSSERVKILSQKQVQAQVEAGKGTLKLGKSDQKAGLDQENTAKRTKEQDNEGNVEQDKEQAKQQSKGGAPSKQKGGFDNGWGKGVQGSSGNNRGSENKPEIHPPNLEGLPMFQGNRTRENGTGQANISGESNREQKSEESDEDGQADYQDHGSEGRLGQQQGEKSESEDSTKSDGTGGGSPDGGTVQGH